MDHWSYDLLKRVAEQEGETSSVNELKQMFAEEIDSPRRLDRIHTITQLIDCLERRDILSEYNVDPLYEMSERFHDGALAEALSRYSVPKEKSNMDGPINEYHMQRLAEQLQQQLHINPHAANNVMGRQMPPMPSPSVQWTSPPNTRAPSQLPHVCTQQQRISIYDVLAKELGMHWRTFGRGLQISEGDMDEIEIKFPRECKSRVHNLLLLFENDASQNPKHLMLNICRALDCCRRKDLRRKVENILSN